MSQRAQRLIEAARKLPLPEGHLRRRPRPADLRASRRTGSRSSRSRASTKSEYAALNGLWILVFVVAPGFFLPLEQEVGPGGRRPARPRDRRRPGRAQGGDRRRRARRRRSSRCSIVGSSPRSRAHRPAVPRAGGPARLLRDRARHLRGAAHHARHALGQRALRPVRDDPRRRGRASGSCPCIVLYAAGIDELALVRARARDPAGARGARVAPGPARPPRARARSAVVGAVDQPLAAVPRVARRAGAQLLAGARRARARARARSSATPPPTSSSASSSPASRSCCSRRSRPRSSRSWPRSSGAGKHDDFRAGPQEAAC